MSRVSELARQHLNRMVETMAMPMLDAAVPTAAADDIGDFLNARPEPPPADEVGDFLRADHPATAAPSQVGSPPTYSPTEGMSPAELRAAGAGSALANLWRGGRQLAAQAGLGDLDQVNRDIAEADRLEAPLMGTTEGQIGRIGGNVLAALPFGGASLPAAALSGAAFGALEPERKPGQRLGNMGAGAAGGALGNVAVQALRPVRSALSPEARGLADRAVNEYGIPLSAAQLTGSRPLKWMEATFSDMPMTAARQGRIVENQQNAFNRAVGRQFDMPVNESKLSPEVLQEARGRIGAQFDDLSARNRLNFDQNALNDITRIRFDAERYNTADVARILNNRIDDILGKVEPDGTISGQAYRQFDSALGRQMRGTANGDLRSALGELRDTVRSAMDRSISAEDAGAWRQARQQYRDLQRVAPVAAKSPTGDVSPALLLEAAKRGDKSAAFRTDDPLLELGRIGKEFLRQMPSSGTAQRTFWQNFPWSMATHGAGLTQVPLQAAMNSRLGTRYLSDGLLPAADVDRIARYLSTPAGIAMARQLTADQ